MYKITPLPKNINNFECIILFEEPKFIIRSLSSFKPDVLIS